MPLHDSAAAVREQFVQRPLGVAFDALDRLGKLGVVPAQDGAVQGPLEVAHRRHLGAPDAALELAAAVLPRFPGGMEGRT